MEASGHPLTERLHISKKAQLILPTHRILDAAYEAAKGDAKVGTCLLSTSILTNWFPIIPEMFLICKLALHWL